jgi:hypothetical protein
MTPPRENIRSLHTEGSAFRWGVRFEHAAAGYGGHARLCGTLGASSLLLNMAAYNEKGAYATLIDQLMYRYAETEFPTDRFDDISSFPKQVKARQ